MGLSVATVSGHEASATNTTPKAADLVSVEVVLNSDVESASPGDELKFQVTVLRIADGHSLTGAVTGPDGADDITGITLDDDTPIKTMEVSYTIVPSDLGVAAERTADLTWTFTMATVYTDGDDTETHTVTAGTNDTATGSAEVTLVKRAGADGSIVGIDLDFSATTMPDSLDKGEKVTFKLTVTTGDTYSLRDISSGTWKSLVVTRQLYDADGDKVGNAIPSAVFTIPTLHTGSTSAELESAPKTHALQTAEADEIADGGKLVFSYVLTVNETDILKAGKVVDLDKDGMVGKDSSDADITAAAANADAFDFNTVATPDKVADLKDDILTLEMPAAPEATPSPYLYMTDAAKVEEIGGGTAIVVTRLDTMTTTTLTLGTLSGGGALLPRDSGYIRDESRGQTYAVVRRASDNMVVRVWISSNSEWVPHVPWANVIAFYNVPAAVLNAIPLDDSMPEVDQLVDVEGTYYVYRDRAWRHIPNLSTFRAEGFYWCDLTTADSSHDAASSTATPLPSKVGPPAEGYPACRGM